MNQSEEQFAADIQQRLSDSLDEIDQNALLRLRQARVDAVQAAARHKNQDSDVIGLSFPQWLAPVSTATAFATVAFLAITVWTQPSSLVQPVTANTMIEDIAVLSSSDDLDLYENLDFYIWLVNEDTAS